MTEAITPREKLVLRAMVESYISNPAPIGSRTIAKLNMANLNLSPATIRNIMADLGDKGYLTQPHVSAGRMPSDKGYRLFVDEIMESKELPNSEKNLIDKNLGNIKETSDELMIITLKLLSLLSSQAGLIILPNVSAEAIRKFHFIKVSPRKLQVVLVTEFHQAHNIMVSMDENLSDAELEKLANYLNRNFGGQSIRQIRKKLRSALRQEKARADILIKRALEIQEKLLASRDSENVIVEGTVKLLDVPELTSNAEKLKKLFNTIANKEKLLNILDKCLEDGKITVSIGSEIQDIGVEDCAIVANSYGRESTAKGGIGVIGPRNMNYPYIFALLNHLCAVLNRTMRTA